MINAQGVSKWGQIYEVGITHIDYIIKNPKMFGTTIEKIREIYKNHGEPVGHEGKAREEIMISILKRGGIRTRNVKGTGTAETGQGNARLKNALGKWAYDISNKGSKFYTVRLLAVKNNKHEVSSTHEILKSDESFKFKDDITIMDIFKSRGNGEKLNEMSLGRVGQHTQKNKADSFGILTSWRAGNTKKQNMAGLKQLEAILKSRGLGFFKMEGHGQEAPDNADYKDVPKDKLIDTKEPSLFVPGISYDLIKKLGKKYSQDAVVHSGPEVKDETVLVFGDGSKLNIGKFHPQKISWAYSKIHGSTFVFEYVAQSGTEKLVEQNYKRMENENS